MSRSLACTLHLWPPGQARRCTGGSHKLAGRLTNRALGHGTRLIRIQLDLGSSRILAQTERRETS